MGSDNGRSTAGSGGSATPGRAGREPRRERGEPTQHPPPVLSAAPPRAQLAGGGRTVARRAQGGLAGRTIGALAVNEPVSTQAAHASEHRNHHRVHQQLRPEGSSGVSLQKTR